jgi:hypothetical protein
VAQEVNERLDILGGLKLPSGAGAGKLLSSDASGNAAWAVPTAGTQATAQSADFTAGPGQCVLMTGAHTVTLPTAPMAGSQVAVVALTGIVTVNRGGTDTINNQGTGALTTLTLPVGTQMTFCYLGGVWYRGGTIPADGTVTTAKLSGALTTPSTLQVTGLLTTNGIVAPAYGGYPIITTQVAPSGAYANFLLAADISSGHAAFIIGGDGCLYWGPGGSTGPDVTLSRNNAGGVQVLSALANAGQVFTVSNSAASGYTGVMMNIPATQAAGTGFFFILAQAASTSKFQVRGDGQIL